MEQSTRGAQAGWYADPTGQAQLRYWTGSAWSEWARNGNQELRLPLRPLTAPRHSDLAHLEFVERTFLPQAQSRGLLDAPRSRALTDLVRALRQEAGDAGSVSTPAAGAPRAVPTLPAGTSAGDLLAASARSNPPRRATSAAPRPGGIPAPHPGGIPAPAPAPMPVRPAPAVKTGPTRWELLRQRLGNELTVNGLAYLGALLLFVGAFGLVAFAFSDVAPSMRPVAEIATAVVPFIGAWILLRSGARVAGRAVEVIGGLIVPIMGITSLVDGFPVPPDPRGIGLPIAATAIALGSAAGAALWTRRHPESGLRHTVAPIIWLSAATATIGVGREMPQGEQVASLTAPQAFAIALALLTTTALARLRPTHPLAQAARGVVVPGLVIVSVLALVTSFLISTPLLALGTAAALIATARLCQPTVKASAFDLIGSGVWGVAAGAAYGAAQSLPLPGLAHHVGLIATLGAAGFIALIELARRDGRSLLPHALAASGLLVAIAATLPSDGWTWPVAVFATGWALWRRATSTVRRPLEAIAAVAPLLLLGSLLQQEILGLSVAAALAVAATVVVRTGALRTGPTDTFWTWWWRGAVLVTGVWAFVVAATSLPDGGGSPTRAWVAIGVAVLVLALCAIGPVPGLLRPWILAAGGAGVWHLVCVLLGTAPLGRTLALAAGAFAVSALGHVRRGERTHGGVAGSTVAAGGALALWAFASTGAAPGLTWAGVVGVAAMVACAALTALRHDRAASPFSPSLERSRLSALPWTLTLLLLALTLALALRLLGALGAQHQWQFTVSAALALLAAATTRVPGLPAHLRSALAPVSITLAAVSLLSLSTINAGVSASASGPYGLWPAIASLATITVLPLVLARASRHPVTVWAGWVAAGPAAWLLLSQLRPAEGSTVNAGWAFAALGSTYLVGAAAHHRIRRQAQAGPEAPADTKRPLLAPPLASPAWTPFAVGGAFALIAAVTALGLGTRGSWIAVVLAAAAVMVGVVLRTGSWLALGVSVGWCATLGLAWADLVRLPWLAALAALAVVVAALALERPSQGRPPLHRWDAPLALPAIVIGGSALVLALSRVGSLRDGQLAASGNIAAAVAITILGLSAIGAATRLLTRPFSFRTAPPRPSAAPSSSSASLATTAGNPRLVLSTLGACWELSAALGAFLLLLAGLVYGGHGPGIMLAVIGAIYVARSLLAAPPRRTFLQIIATGTLLVGWFVILGSFDVPTATIVTLTCVTGAVLTLALALVLRQQPLPGAMVAGVGALTLTGLGLIRGAFTGINSATPGEAIGLVASTTPVIVAVGMALVAGRIRGRWWRESAAAVLVLTSRLIMDAGHVPAPTQVIGLSVGACVAVALLLWAVRRPGREWAPSLTTASVLATVLALAHAAGHQDGSGINLGLVAVPVGAAALQAACLGIAWRRPSLVRLSPILACLAWLILARWANLDGLQFYTAAIGLTLLVVVELWRRDLRLAGSPDGAIPLRALEFTGIGFLLLGPLVQSLTSSPLHALIGVAIGIAVTLWGIATRIRRRVRTGVVVVLGFVGALVLIPLVKVLPELGSAGLWIAIAVVGLLAVLVAALMERGKKVVRSGFARIWGDDPDWE